jgi:hypothetical protein
MDIAAELREEASQRAGSPEGFLQVIRLVLKDMGETAPSFPSNNGPDLKLCPEWAWPETYIPVFREYVCSMQQVLYFKWRWEANPLSRRFNNSYPGKYIPDEYKQAQKELNDLIHTAKKKKRELPIHAYKRLVAIETRYANLWAGRDNMYAPKNWESVSAEVEAYISNFGIGRDVNHDREVSHGDC